MAVWTDQDHQPLPDGGGSSESGDLDAQTVRNGQTENLAGGRGRFFVREFVV